MVTANFTRKKTVNMVSLNENYYRHLATALLNAIGEKNFYNGTLNFDTEEFTSTLRTTVIVYREKLDDPADPTGRSTKITDIVPVWWEYHMFFPDGEHNNEFSWGDFRKYLL